MTTAPQEPDLLAGEIVNAAVDCSGLLDSGETISGSVTVTDATGDLTITSAQASGSTLTIDGVSVAAGLAVQCKIDTTAASSQLYTLRVSFVTSAGQTRKGDIVCNVCA